MTSQIMSVVEYSTPTYSILVILLQSYLMQKNLTKLTVLIVFST